MQNIRGSELPEQPSFDVGMGSMPLPRNLHEEHNDSYCALPSTFLLDEFALKSHSQAEKWSLWKLRVKCLIFLIGPLDLIRVGLIFILIFFNMLHRRFAKAMFKIFAM